MKTQTANASAAAPANTVKHTSIRTGLGAAAIAAAVTDNLRFLQATLPRHAVRNDWYMALACSVRDRLLDRCLTTVDVINEAATPTKLVAYLSAEFLTGPHRTKRSRAWRGRGNSPHPSPNPSFYHRAKGRQCGRPRPGGIPSAMKNESAVA